MTPDASMLDPVGAMSPHACILEPVRAPVAGRGGVTITEPL
jgi:hypothetical protein